MILQDVYDNTDYECKNCRAVFCNPKERRERHDGIIEWFLCCPVCGAPEMFYKREEVEEE